MRPFSSFCHSESEPQSCLSRNPQALEYLPNWGSQSCGHLASPSTSGTQLPCLGSGDATELLLMGYTTCVRCEDGSRVVPKAGGSSSRVRGATGTCLPSGGAGCRGSDGSLGTRLSEAVPFTQPGLHYIWSTVEVSSHLPSWGDLLSATAHSLPCAHWGGGVRREGL